MDKAIYVLRCFVARLLYEVQCIKRSIWYLKRTVPVHIAYKVHKVHVGN